MYRSVYLSISLMCLSLSDVSKTLFQSYFHAVQIPMTYHLYSSQAENLVARSGTLQSVGPLGTMDTNLSSV